MRIVVFVSELDVRATFEYQKVDRKDISRRTMSITGTCLTAKVREPLDIIEENIISLQFYE